MVKDYAKNFQQDYYLMCHRLDTAGQDTAEDLALIRQLVDELQRMNFMVMHLHDIIDEQRNIIDELKVAR